MRIVSDFEHGVREVEHAWIPMPDGCRLAARLWLPEDAESHPVPAVVEYIPYRKRAGTRWRDEPIHRYFAGHGYASVRVDVRGSGESEGRLDDEYSEAELADGEALVGWLASQLWCSGRVGVIGKSWGGINALQLAARRPAGLGAVISVCATDDRWTTDAHYMGGCLLNENLKWGSALLTIAALPPDPALVPGWRGAWLERLDSLPLYPELWMRHPERDAYWRRDAVMEDYERIACPVFAVGGWADAYTDAVFRLLEGLRVPKRGLVGPWAHVYPHDGQPGPAIGFLQEAVRWWDRWLKGIANGAGEEPELTAWIEGAGAQPGETGRWVSEPRWPAPQIAPRHLFLSDAGLEAGAPRAPTPERRIATPLQVGEHAGAWCPFGPDELPGEQAGDDESSVVFDTPPLVSGFDLLGVPLVELEVVAGDDDAQVALRLVDVAPDGRARRVSYGLMDLSRAGAARGERWRGRVALAAAGHAFAPGHRVRLAISSSYWPIAWPSRGRRGLRLSTGVSSLRLPVRPPREADASVVFPPAEAAPEPAHLELSEEVVLRSVRRAAPGRRGEIRVVTGADAGGRMALTRYEDIGLEVGHVTEERYAIGATPASARTRIAHRRLLRRGSWSATIETWFGLSAGRDAYRLLAGVEAWEGATRVFERRWRRRIPRGKSEGGVGDP